VVWAGNRFISLCYNRPDLLDPIVEKVKPFKDCSELTAIYGCTYFYWIKPCQLSEYLYDGYEDLDVHCE